MPDVAERRPGLLRRILRWVTGAEIRDRLVRLERLLRDVQKASSERSREMDARVAEPVQQQPTGKDLRELRQAVQKVVAALDERPRAGAPGIAGAASRDERRLHKRLDALASSDRPILIGPWTGEVGFELLYWVPFVEWLRSQWYLQSKPTLVVSRGGVASWYRTAETDYEDVFAHCTPDDFRTAVTAERRKQRRPSSFDQQMIDAASRSRGLENVEVIHPSLMYRLFEPYWRDDAGYAQIDRFTRYRLLDAPRAQVAGLPPEYVAVRFYFGESFPDTPDNRAFANGVVASLAERTPVVLLNPGFSVDEHFDWSVDARGRVYSIADQLTPTTNLGVQSAVLAGARAFVGNYGGYSYLAPLLGVPAVAFYSRALFERHHLYAAERAFERIGAAALTPVDVAQARLVQSALGVAMAQS